MEIKYAIVSSDENPLYYADSYFTYSYFERGLYVDKIKRWMEVFPKEQFLIIQSEEFFKNPSRQRAYPCRWRNGDKLICNGARDRRPT